MDRSGWTLPGSGPAGVGPRPWTLWDEGCFRCHVEDGFEVGPSAQAPSTIPASLEAALGVYDELNPRTRR